MSGDPETSCPLISGPTPAYEYLFPGGLNDLDDNRTDIYLLRQGNGLHPWELILLPGTATLTVHELSSRELRGLAQWILEILGEWHEQDQERRE